LTENKTKQILKIPRLITSSNNELATPGSYESKKLDLTAKFSHYCGRENNSKSMFQDILIT